MSHPIIALLTDFGQQDHYAGTMKGVALGICPDANLVDITHNIPAQDIVAGALELAAAYRYFPLGTVFLVVVDPGVGSSRRGVAVEAGDYRFVGPDNGVLSIALEQAPARSIVELTDGRFARPDGSRTFEGRDRFAPAAAWLAKGVEVGSLGRPARDLTRLELPRPQLTTEGVVGVVLRVDNFGNLVTNIDRGTFEESLHSRRPVIRLGDRELSTFVSTYADALPGELCALFGSSGYLEVAVSQGNASHDLAAGRGTAVCVTTGS